MPKGSKTSSFGTTARISHDASPYYNSKLYAGLPSESPPVPDTPFPETWKNQIIEHSAEKMSELRASGDRLWFTTDGQMCTDTPYCGVERLLPYYCFKYDVEAYEFWGIDWLTYDPYEFGWHSFIHQSGEPGKSSWVRYPNGDGFLAYPGASIGHDGPVSSIRLEQAREGVEDYEYLYLLRSLVRKAKANGEDATQGDKALDMAKRLVDIPNAGGRYSTKILPNPDAVFEVKEAVAGAIEKLIASK